jgi:hypothetical protein
VALDQWHGRENDLKRQLKIWLPTTASAAFQPLTKSAAKLAFTTLFSNHVLIVKAIIVPAIDAFLHSSIIFMLQ